MRKLFSLFLALLATTSLWAHDFEVDGIYYNYLEDNNVKVTYRGNRPYAYDNEYAGEVTIPSTVTYNGTTYSVTSIGDWAFYECESLTSVTIPNSVTSIGEQAFRNCISLTSVTIGNSVTSIGEYAFDDCYSLTSITIPNSVTSIGEYAFYLCSSLTSVTIGNSVTSIGSSAFAYCESLTSITIPNSVTSIGSSAFYDCISLTSITIPNNVTSIGEYAFYLCSSLTSIICLGTTPPDASNLGANTSTCKLIVPHYAYNAYLRHAYWGQFLNIVSGNWVGNRDMTIIFTNSEDNDNEILSQVLTITFPAAPEIEGFTFLGWKATDEFISDVITIQAIYEANAPASAPEVYVNPANPAQKLLRNGQVYILKDDKTYNIMGAQIQ